MRNPFVENRLVLGLALFGLMAVGALADEAAEQAPLPHVVFVLADDMGWGDPQCYNPDSAIPTPNMDRLASEGCRFTDAHASGAVCTPSRYGFITGRYFWRLSRTIQGLNGYGGAIIETDRPTLPRTMKDRGYHTVMLGKWHLGLTEETPADFSGKMVPNPTTYGFDYYFGLAASLDFPPYCWVENDEAVVKPTETIAGTDRGQPRFWRAGAIAPGFKLEDVLPTLTEKTVKTLADHAPKKEAEPLFLYVPLPSPHTPCLPDEEARGKSHAGDYGDYVWQVDRSIGDILRALDDHGYTDNTLFILSSDNGGLQTWIPEEYQHHKTNGPWRGQKADAYEGGHRVPFFVRWPGHVKPGSTSDELIGIHDLYATIAAITGTSLPEGAAPDSMNVLPAFLGGTSPRDTFVVESSRRMATIRHGDWKLIEGLGSGGFGWNPKEHEPWEAGPQGQLYNLKDDPAETKNLWLEKPEKVAELLALLEQERNRT